MEKFVITTPRSVGKKPTAFLHRFFTPLFYTAFLHRFFTPLLMTSALFLIPFLVKAQGSLTDCDLFFTNNLNISNSNDMIFNCTRNTFSADFCNNNLYEVSGVTVTIEVPVGINPVGLNGFVNTGQITRVFGGSAFVVFNIFTRVVSIPANGCINLGIDGIGTPNGGTILSNPNFFFVSITPPLNLNGVACPQVKQESQSELFAYKTADEITGNGAVFLTNNSALPSLICNPNVNAGDRYIVNGDLNLTAANGNGTTYCFNDAFVFLRPNARIVVEEGVICNIHASSFRACENELWGSIVVVNEGTLNVDNELQAAAAAPPRAEFFDAVDAITALDGATVTVSDTRFINNRVGVRLVNNSNTVIDNDCVFQGTDILKPSTVINTDDFPYAGIVAEDNSFVSVFNADFIDLANGIVANNSSVFTWNNDFTNMLNNQTLYPFQGFGVRSNNNLGLRNVTSANCNYTNCQKTSIYTVGANVVTSGGSINNTPIGILAHRDEGFNVNGVQFNNATQGINAIGNRRFRMNIIDNNFTNGTNIGIGLRFNSYPTRGFIRNNEMTLSGTAAIKSEYPTLGESFEITENPHIRFSGEDAIRISSGERVRVHRNFDIDLLSGSRGVFVEGGSFNDVNCNSVTNRLGSQAGMRFEASAQPIVACNEVFTPLEAVSIRFDGTSAMTDLATNNMHCTNPILQNNVFGQGLLLTENARIGEQRYQGNSWINSGATNQNQDFGASLFTVFTGGPTPHPNFMPKFRDPFTWFLDIPLGPGQGTQKFCEGTTCPIRPPSVATDSEVDVIFTDGIGFGNFAANATWNMRQQYYSILSKDPALLAASNTEVQNLYQQLATGDIGQLYQVEQLMHGLYSGTTGQEAQRSELKNDIEAAILIVRNAEETWRNADEDSKPALWQQRSEALANLNTLYTSSDELEEAIETTVSQNIEAVELLNAAITSEMLPAQNMQKVNHLYLKVIALENSNLSADETSSLNNIAFQCPYSGGEAVYRARAIYEYLNGTTDFPEDCAPIAPRMMANTTLKDELPVLYPNPAGDYVMLNMPETDYNKMLSVSFINAQGAVVLTQQANAVERINTDILPSGLYTCIVKDAANGATLKAQKITIIRN